MYECGAQVGDPHVPGARKKDIFWLEIAMKDTHIVESIETESLRNTVSKVDKYRWKDRNPQSGLSTAVVAY